MGSEILHNPARLRISWGAPDDVAAYHVRIGEPSLDPPYEPNPMRLDPDDCPYGVLRDHLLDEALGRQDPRSGWQEQCVRYLLLGIYSRMGVREITLNPDEEQRLT